MNNQPSGISAKCSVKPGDVIPIRIRPVYGSLAIVLMMMLVANSGCNWLRWANSNVTAPPNVFNQMATKDEIIQRVNYNSKAIRSLQAKVHVRATGTPTLSGDLTVEQPSRLRMQAGLLNMNNSGIDLGSNDDQFWVWIKTPMPGQPPAVLYANHDEYENSSVKKSLPIEPAWVIDSLGLAYFDPRAEHLGPFQRPDGSVEIRSRYQSASGMMVKSTIVDPRTSVVIGQELYQGNTKIAASRASRHQYFKEWNASIPQQVEIEVGMNTAQPGKVTMELSRIRPNSVDQSYAGLWQMPRPSNINMIDLAKQAPAVSGVERSLVNQDPRMMVQPGPAIQGTTRQFQSNMGPANGRPFPPGSVDAPQAIPNPYQNPSGNGSFDGDRGVQSATYNQFEYDRPSIRGFGSNRSN